MTMLIFEQADAQFPRDTLTVRTAGCGVVYMTAKEEDNVATVRLSVPQLLELADALRNAVKDGVI